MIDGYNHNKLFISEKNKYYIRDDNKSIQVQILNEFKDIKKSYGINVYDITNSNCYKIDDITINYYKIDEPYIIKHCTILLIDYDDHSKMFISKKICTIFVMILIMIMMLMVMIVLMMIMVIMIILMMIMVIMIMIIMMIIIMIMIIMMMISIL